MKNVDFIIPIKPKLIFTDDGSNLPERVTPPPPLRRAYKRSESEIFSKKPERRKLCSNLKVSDAPPHTKFTVLPSRAITDPRINTRKPLLLLLGAIGIHASIYGICYPSQRRLAKLCGKSTSWANKYLAELKHLGYVRRLVQPKFRGLRTAHRLQVLWKGNDPLPEKEADWNKAPWCWR